MADICYDYDREADPVYHQATKCIPEKPIREEKQKASHTSDSTVCPVCDWVHDEEGGMTFSADRAYCSTPALQ